MRKLDLRNTKIYVNGKSKDLKNKLLKMDCVSTEIEGSLNYLDYPFVYIDKDLFISYGTNMSFFKENENKELQLQDVLDYEIPKTDWKDELQVGSFILETNYDKGICVDSYYYKYTTNVIVYDNKEQAELDAKKLQLHLEMLRFAELRNRDWRPKEEDYNEGMWGIKLNKDFAYIDIIYYENDLFLQIPFKSEEIAKEALELFGERIKEVYL